MKKCIKCRQQIPDDSDVCTYCGQWQEQIQEKSSIKTTKQCIKCKQHIPIDCEECTFCGQTQPVEKRDKDIDSNIDMDKLIDTLEKDDKKKRKKIVFLVLSVCVLIVVGVVVLTTMVSALKSKPAKSYSSHSSYTEPTTVDNSVGGNGYYYFDNKLNEATVEKFNNVFYGDTGGISLDISVDDFSYIGDVMLLDEKVSQYNYIDFNGKTGVFIYVNEDNQVSAFTFAYDTKMLNDPTTSAEYVNKQLVGRPASWIYALSDTLTYEKAYEIYKTLYVDRCITEIVNANEEGRKPKVAFYYSGYAIIATSSTANAQDNITVFKADSDFIEKNNIGTGKQTIFQPIDTGTDGNSAVSTTNGETTEETTISEPVAVSDEEIAEAEDLLQEESFGSDYLGSQFSEALNALDAIYFYFDDVTLEATKDYYGNIILKYTGSFYDETNYVAYEVNTKNGYVNFIDSSFSWEALKEFYPADLYNDYMQEQ